MEMCSKHVHNHTPVGVSHSGLCLDVIHLGLRFIVNEG